MPHDSSDRRNALVSSQRRRWILTSTLLLGSTVLAAPVTAHGTAERTVGLAFPAVVAASVGASLLGGGLVFAAVDRLPGRVGPSRCSFSPSAASPSRSPSTGRRSARASASPLAWAPSPSLAATPSRTAAPVPTPRWVP
ncbi:hypothetical protein ACFQL0_09420 [Haloplanus litoreus]|uniref:hypothetical protein n=1 Tax=Haloplanus litoreus TaxID=767515 RepID=UPI003611E02D